MRKFSDLTAAEQTDIARRFVLPEDESQVQVDEYNRPFVDMVMCTVINTNFHVYSNRKNRV